MNIKAHEMIVAESFEDYCAKEQLDAGSIGMVAAKLHFALLRRDARERTLKRVGKR